MAADPMYANVYFVKIGLVTYSVRTGIRINPMSSSPSFYKSLHFCFFLCLRQFFIFFSSSCQNHPFLFFLFLSNSLSTFSSWFSFFICLLVSSVFISSHFSIPSPSLILLLLLICFLLLFESSSPSLFLFLYVQNFFSITFPSLPS